MVLDLYFYIVLFLILLLITWMILTKNYYIIKNTNSKIEKLLKKDEKFISYPPPFIPLVIAE